jgi:Holliday junction resolvasome RuvABC endonuclease subunit
VLAIDPSTRGFGFAILEGPERLIDWGVKETKTDKNKRSLKLIAELIEQYGPSVLVLEDYIGKGSRRCRRVAELIEAISKLAAKRKLKVKMYSRAKVKLAFSESGASNKQDIAIGNCRALPGDRAAFTAFQKAVDERGLPDEHL